MSNSQNGEMDAATLDEQHAQTELLQSIERRLELPIPVRVQEPIRVTVDKVSKTSLADGAATEAKQDVGNTSLASIDTKLTNPIPVTVGALPLPAGAATAARQDTGNASLASIDAGTPAALGQTTMANSMPVTLASDQSSVGHKSSAGAVTTVSVSSTSTQLLAANASRKGFTVTNIGGNSCYVALGFTPTTSSYSRQLNTAFPNDTWEVFGHSFTGVINAIRASGTTNVIITELT